MSSEIPNSKLPAAWLRQVPPGYKIPLWRWLLLPATSLMLKRNGGVWMSGELVLLKDALSFTQSVFIKSARTPPINWTIPLVDISSVGLEAGLMSETLAVHHSGGTVKLMTARSGEFRERLEEAIASASSST